jgi:hypothetical protein
MGEQYKYLSWQNKIILIVEGAEVMRCGCVVLSRDEIKYKNRFWA